jgi:hypothetical protein
MTHTSTRVGVELIYQLLNGGFTITRDKRWAATSGGNHSTTDNQQTIVIAKQATLNDNLSPHRCGHREGPANIDFIRQ